MARTHPRRDGVPEPRRRAPSSPSESGSRDVEPPGAGARGPGHRAWRPRRPSSSRPTRCSRWITAYAAVHKAGAVVVPTNTRLTAPELAHDPRARRGGGHRSPVTRCSPLVHEVRDGLPSLRAVVSTDRAPTTACTTGTTSSTTTTASTRCRSSSRPRRRDVHVGHHRAAQGDRRAPRQRRHDPQPRAARGSGAAGCTARRCSRSPASRSSTTR